MPKAGRIPTVRFNLKSHDKEKDKNKDVLILLVYRYNEKRLLYSTGEVVKPKYWDVKTRRPKIVRNHLEYSGVSNRLNILENICRKIYEDFDYGNISIDDFKNELDYRSERKARPTKPDTHNEKGVRLR